MGFIDDKGESFDKISVFKVANGIPKRKATSSFESVNSKSKNLLPFLMDILSSSCLDNTASPKDKARCEGSRMLTDILVDFLPKLTGIVKEGIIKGIKAGLACGSDFTIPTPTPSFTAPLKSVDLGDLMKVDPTGPGGLFYGSITTDLNRFLYNVVQSPGTTQTWDSILDVTFDSSTQDITVQINNSYAGISFELFMEDYINSIELFSEKTTISTLLDFMFGTISSELNLSFDTMLSLEQMDMATEKILDVDPCTDDLVIDNSFFTFNNEELNTMEENARDKSRGVRTVDLGCGLMEVVVDISVLSEATKLDTATPSEIKDILTRTVESAGNQAASFASPEDQANIKSNFGKSAVFSLPKVFARLILSPKVIVLYQIASQSVNDVVVKASNGYDFSKAATTFFEFVIRESFAAILELIFKKVVDELLKLVESVISKIIKEKISLYMGALAGMFLGIIEDAAGDVAEQIKTPDTGNLI